jgi:hypothetical protein
VVVVAIYLSSTISSGFSLSSSTSRLPQHHIIRLTQHHISKLLMASPEQEMRDDEPGLQLPDINAIADCYQTLAAEHVKFNNFPVFDAGHTILLEIRELRQETREIMTRLQATYVALPSFC